MNPGSASSLSLFPRRFTPEQASAYLRGLGIPVSGVRIVQTSSGGKYWKWRAQWRGHVKTISREIEPDVREALRVLEVERDRLLAEIPTATRRALGLQTRESVRRTRAAQESQPPPK